MKNKVGFATIEQFKGDDNALMDPVLNLIMQDMQDILISRSETGTAD